MPLFLGNRKRKGRKERVLKQKPLKGLHQSQNVNVLAILEHLELRNSVHLEFSVP